MAIYTVAHLLSHYHRPARAVVQGIVMSEQSNHNHHNHHSARLAAHLVNLKPAMLDGSIGTNATMALLDTVGVGLYGANQQWGRILREQILGEGSRGKATLFGESVTVAPSRAALANGTASHGFELDDISQGALVHPGAVEIPAAATTLTSKR